MAKRRGPYKKHARLGEVVIEPAEAVPSRQHTEVRTLLNETRARMQALIIVDEMLTERAAARALAAAPRKLLLAATTRAHARPTPTRQQKTTRKKPVGRSAATQALSIGNNTHSIGGSRLTLFLLEHLDPAQGKTHADLLKALSHDGFTGIEARALNPALGVAMQRNGLARRDAKTKQYLLTAKGHAEALVLRRRLEEKNWIVPNGYRVPPATLRAHPSTSAQ